MNDLESTISAIWEREKAFEKARKDEAEYEHVYKVKKAVEYKTASGTIQSRENTAVINCKDEYKHYLVASAIADIAKAKLDDARQVLSARQSILSARAKGDFAYANSRSTT